MVVSVVDVGDMVVHVVGVIPVIFFRPVNCPCCHCCCHISLHCHQWVTYPHPVVLWLVNMGYGGGRVLTLGPCNIASGREGTNDREQVGGGGVGRKEVM